MPSRASTRKGPFTATILAALLLPTASIAVALDQDADGISDLWAQAFPLAHADPAGDQDADGVTNRGEGQVWTSPIDAQDHLTAVALPGTAPSLRWPGTPWRRFGVLQSGDLADWRRLPLAWTGTGAPVTHTEATAGARAYHRVQSLESLNSDTDALTNLEEARLGTLPALTDSDGDRVADDVEYLLGADPLRSLDSDADGLPDDWERWIIAANPADAVVSLTDVTPSGDFDGDGMNNLDEWNAGSDPTRRPRNILLFLTEDQGYHLGCLGAAGLDTPNLDRLAASGTLFERAFSVSPVCSPSKMGLFTGTFPHTNSAHRNVPNYGTAFPLPASPDPSNLSLGGVHEDLPTWVELLRERGYFTAVSSKSHVQPVRKFPYHEGYGNPSTPAAASALVDDTVTQAAGRPFFLLFNIASPHLPFRALPQANGVWDPAGGLLGDGGVTNVDPASIEIPTCYPDTPGVRQDFADYYGAIEVIDQLFGSVTNALQARGVWADTLVVFTSDHGIGLHRAKQSVYGAGLHVPMIVSGPGVASAPGVRRIRAPVSHVDLMPTLLEYIGLPGHSGLAGRSLWPILGGARTDLSGRETVLTACHEKYDGRAVCDGRYYYIRNTRKVAGASVANPGPALNEDQYAGGSPWYNRSYDATLAATGSPQRALLVNLLNGAVPDEELYDMETDFWMTQDLAGDPGQAATLGRLRRQLDLWREATEDYHASPTEMTRRTARFTPLTAPDTSHAASFDGLSGALAAQPGWTTPVLGNGTADFTVVGDLVRAPAGPRALARHLPSALPAGRAFTASVKTGFSGTGVAGGVAFGIQETSPGQHAYWQFLLADGRSSPGGLNKDVRLFRITGNTTVAATLISDDALPNYPAGFAAPPAAWFTVTVSGIEGSSRVNLRILRPDGTVYFNSAAFDLGQPVPAGSGFGLTTFSSANSSFDDFSVGFYP